MTNDPIRERAERLKELVCVFDGDDGLRIRLEATLEPFGIQYLIDDVGQQSQDLLDALDREKDRGQYELAYKAAAQEHATFLDKRAEAAEAERDTLRKHADELASAVDGSGDIHEREFKIAAAKYWCAFPKPATQTEGE